MGPQRRRHYLKEHHRVLYYNMLTKCNLYPHLADVEQQAQEMFFRLIDEMSKQKGLTEQLKEADLMECVRKMNNIRDRVTEIVNSALIYEEAEK